MSARERSRRGKELKRKIEERQPLKTFRIYSEGDKSEPDYIEAMKKLPHFKEQIAAEIVIEYSGGVPLTLVQNAVRDKRQSKFDIDEYWCVFDVEFPKQHPNLSQAKNLAISNNIKVAISNPCFELWLVLHHNDQTAHLSTDDANKQRLTLDKQTGKNVSAEFYMPKRVEAIRRAKILEAKHQKDGTSFPQDNPSSSFYNLVEQLNSEIEDEAK